MRNSLCFKKHTVIFSSHVLSEVSAICDRIVVISNGEITADSKTEELSAITDDAGRLSLIVEGAASTVLSVLGDVDGVIKVRREASLEDNAYSYLVDYKKDRDIRRGVFRALAKADCPILEMRGAGKTLEESFLYLTDVTKVERVQKNKKGGKN